MDLSSVLPAGWTPFGLSYPYNGDGVDTTISVNSNIANQIQTYRDLTINSGIVLTAGFSPQFVFARKIIFGNTTSQISANGLGGAGGVASVQRAGRGALFPAYFPTGTTDDSEAYTSTPVGPTGVVPWFDLLLANGGDTVDLAIGTAGGASTIIAVSLSFLLQELSSYIALGFSGGGGGGAGASAGSGTGGTVSLGGKRGYSAIGKSGAGYNAGGGGSGIGGGGAGGCANWGAGTGLGGNGGAGGGNLIVICDSLIGAAGLITANGVNGSDGTVVTTAGGGGGGGGGGLCLVMARISTVTPTLQANGGAAGVAGNTTIARDGRAGGAGVSLLRVG